MWKKLKFWGKLEETKTVIEDNSTVIMNSVLIESIGIRIIEGKFAPLIDKGMPVPAEKKYTFSTWADNQDQIMLFFYRGNNELVESNTFLGAYQITNIPLEPAGEPSVELTIGVSDLDIWIAVKNLKTDKALQIISLGKILPPEIQ